MIGVTYNKKNKKYQARITVNGVRKNIGMFATEEAALMAVKDAKNKTKPMAKNYTFKLVEGEYSEGMVTPERWAEKPNPNNKRPSFGLEVKDPVHRSYR